MMLKFQRRSNRATVLIAVLSILAVLSLLAATFGMVMLVELSASKNQTEYEMAREAAHSGYEYLMRELKNAGSAALSGGTMPDICPDPTNRFFCQELGTQRGVKFGYVLGEYDSTHHAAASASWPRDVGMTNSGMVNINGHGNAADMGDPDYIGGNRYTSFETSLMRLLQSRFSAPGAIPVGGSINPDTDIEDFFGDGNWPANTNRVAQYIASAIVIRRYGADGLPGRRGREDGRHDHLPAWFRATPYWVAKDPFLDHDNGAAASGVFWGEVAGVAGAGPWTMTVDNTGPGWLDWPANRWNGWYVYFVTGPNEREWAQISVTTSPNQIDVNPPVAPTVGDRFCIVPTGSSTACDIGENDSLPTAIPWPNGELACENYIQPLAYRKGTVLDPPFMVNSLALDYSPAASVVGSIIRITEGPLRGQARIINSVLGNTVGLTPALPSLPVHVVDTSGLVSALGTVTTLDVAGTPWGINEHKGRVIELTDNTPGPAVVEYRVILSNSANQIVIDGATPFSNAPDVGDTYRILHLGYRIEFDYLDARQVNTVPTMNTVQAAGGPGWADDQWIGCVCNVYSSGDANEIGQTRLILDNTSDTLVLDRTWNDPPDSGAALFRIELPQDAKYRPDDLQGDDMAYRSVPEIIPVMVDAIEHDPNYAFTSTEAGNIAAMLYSVIKDDLTISSGLKKEEGAGINDWLLDGIDNDDDGVIDDDNENLDLSVPADLEKLATNLYNNLGLRDWAHDSDTANRVAQSAQIVANIIDFRDDDHVPVALTYSDIGEDAVYAFGTLYGAEGLHITEVMTTPAVVNVLDTDIDVVSMGAVGDGGTSGGDLGTEPAGSDVDDDDNDWDSVRLVPGDWDGWDWDGVAGCWRVYDPAAVTGSWIFTGLRDGWYAIRIHGGSATDTMTLTQGLTVSGNVTTDFDYNPPAGEWWGYVRDAVSGRLTAVQVTGGVLSFNLTANVGVEFYGFQLLPQYIEITNVAANDIQLGAHELQVAAMYPAAYPPPVTFDLPNDALIRGASADGVFPINYGTYVIAMSEDAYDRQWGANSSGYWGDAAGEDYPVWFVGDDAALGDELADKLLLDSAAPAVTLRDGTTVLAGGAIDGTMSVPTNDAISIEKTTLLGTTWGDYESVPTAAELMGSQNRVTASSVYTGLNRSFTALWNGVTYSDIRPPTVGATNPAFDSAGMIAGKEVLPIILNRPYASPGWLGLVPVGNIDTFEWRTIDFDPTLHNPPAFDSPPASPVELLGTLMTRALVGGVHARMNLNSPSDAAVREHSFKTVFDDATANYLSTQAAWANWDQLLDDATLQLLGNAAGLEDSGAGTFADDFVDDTDEVEEWARRYSNLIDLQTSNLRFVIAGLVYDAMARDNSNPLAEARIELELDISGLEPKVVHYRYLTE